MLFVTLTGHILFKTMFKVNRQVVDDRDMTPVSDFHTQKQANLWLLPEVEGPSTSPALLPKLRSRSCRTQPPSVRQSVCQYPLEMAHLYNPRQKWVWPDKGGLPPLELYLLLYRWGHQTSQQLYIAYIEESPFGGHPLWVPFYFAGEFPGRLTCEDGCFTSGFSTLGCYKTMNPAPGCKVKEKQTTLDC